MNHFLNFNIDCREVAVNQTQVIITLLHLITLNTWGLAHKCIARTHSLTCSCTHADTDTYAHPDTIAVSCCLRKRGAVWCHSNQCGYPTEMTDWQDPNEIFDTEMNRDHLSVWLCVCQLSVWLVACQFVTVRLNGGSRNIKVLQWRHQENWGNKMWERE